MKIKFAELKVLLFILFAATLLLSNCKNQSQTEDATAAQLNSTNQTGQAIDPEKRLQELGISLYTPEPPVANYVRTVRTGNLVFVSGHGPRKPEGGYVTGKVGRDLNIEQGKQAARLTAISMLSSLKAEIGDLKKVRRIVRVFGMVNATEDFQQQPQVINGCSDLLVELFGNRGKHARAAVGMASLPFNIAVEIEMVVEVE